MKDIIRLNGYSVFESEKFINDYLSELWEKEPSKPKLLNTSPNKEELEKYNILVVNYERDIKSYKENKIFKDSESLRLYKLLINLVKHDSDLESVPEQYRDKLYNYSYNQGHSSGYSKVYNILCELVDIFN